jgi:ATP-dependent RNA helicase RhlE
VIIPVDRRRKRELLSHLITSGRIDRALVFTRTKYGASRLAEQLEHDGISAGAIHGNKTQGQRIRALDDFKEGRIDILVATEVAARGLDIDGLPHVVNFELPTQTQDYVHRIGRTGRAGLEGDAVSLVCIDELELLHDIERLLRIPIPREFVAGFEPDQGIRAEPIREVRGGRGMPGRTPGRHASGRPAPARSHDGRRPTGRPAGSRPAGPRPTGARPQGPRPQGPRGGPRPAGPARHDGIRNAGPAAGFVAMPGERFSRGSTAS